MRIATNVSDEAITAHANFTPGDSAHEKNLGAEIAPRPPDPAQAGPMTSAFVRATCRHHYRPSHFHFIIYKPGFKTMISQIYVPDDEHVDSDVQLASPARYSETMRHALVR
jgi:Dioxygenase